MIQIIIHDLGQNSFDYIDFYLKMVSDYVEYATYYKSSDNDEFDFAMYNVLNTKYIYAYYF